MTMRSSRVPRHPQAQAGVVDELIQPLQQRQGHGGRNMQSASASGINVSSTRRQRRNNKELRMGSTHQAQQVPEARPSHRSGLFELHFGAREFQFVAAFERDRGWSQSPHH